MKFVRKDKKTESQFYGMLHTVINFQKKQEGFQKGFIEYFCTQREKRNNLIRAQIGNIV